MWSDEKPKKSQDAYQDANKIYFDYIFEITFQHELIILKIILKCI